MRSVRLIKTIDSLGKCGAKFTVQSVPGCFELPFATKSLLLAANGKYHAAISIGVLIKGETMHFEYISSATTDALMRVGLDLCVPVIFGVLTCLDADQANERCGLGSSEKKHNHGIDWGFAAVEMARLSSSSG